MIKKITVLEEMQLQILRKTGSNFGGGATLKLSMKEIEKFYSVYLTSILLKYKKSHEESNSIIPIYRHRTEAV